MPIRLIICGLRRSGTTVFWETWRQDARLTCYDEPFNPRLSELAGPRPTRHPEEFQRLLTADARAFWEKYSGIRPRDELIEDLTGAQREYLQYLGGTGEHVTMDVTRCHFKIAALREVAPMAVLVHLFRRPESLVTSHLVPTPHRTLGALRRFVDRQRFWSRDRSSDYWNLESIIGRSPGSTVGRRLETIGLDAQDVYRMPAVGRLLAYWRLCHDVVERDGRRWFGDDFVSQPFEEFCRSPQRSLAHIYERLELEAPAIDSSRIRAPRGPFQPSSPRWAKYRARLGLADP